MLSNQMRMIAVTALAPLAWGTTYLVTTELLPPDRPLTAAVLRALPAGLLILAVTRTLPRGDWWWRSAVLGTLNIGAFFAFLFIAAYRLPGGVAATVGAIQPLVVGVLAAKLIGEALTRRRVLAGVAGVAGVSLLVLQASGQLDTIGLVAAFAGILSMASGIVLAKKWGQPERPLVTTSWQLIAGGVVLLPLALWFEGIPDQPVTLNNVIGYVYLGLVGAVLAYTLWFRGIDALPVGSITFLSLLSPVVAVFSGWVVLQQTLSFWQIIGTAIIFAAILLGLSRPAERDRVLSTDPAGSAHSDSETRVQPIVSTERESTRSG